MTSFSLGGTDAAFDICGLGMAIVDIIAESNEAFLSSHKIAKGVMTLVDEARARGEEQAKAVIDDANREAADIRARARRDAEEERNAQLGEVRSQVAQLAIAAAQRVIGETLVDEQSARAIVAYHIEAVK